MIGFWGGFRAKCSKGAVFYYIRCFGSSSNNWPWFLQRVQVLYLLMFWFLRIAWRVLFVRRFFLFGTKDWPCVLPILFSLPGSAETLCRGCVEGFALISVFASVFLFLLYSRKKDRVCSYLHRLGRLHSRLKGRIFEL